MANLLGRKETHPELCDTQLLSCPVQLLLLSVLACRRCVLLRFVCYREVHRLGCELDSAGLKAAVLLETVETLQAGGSSEEAQRVVVLTAQLAAAQAQGAAQEARIRQLMVGGQLCVCGSPHDC